MADECTDIKAVEELSVLCRREEDGTPVKCFLDIVPLKKADAESICLALLKCIKDKSLQVGNIVGMGFDGAPSFPGKKTGWCSSKTKETCSTCSVCPLSPLAISLKLPIARLELNMSISQKEIQHVLNQPEMKVIKPSDTHWLAHERCVKAVKVSYTALVVTLDSNYQHFHAPEAL